MIGNKQLQALFSYPDEDTSLNQLLELLKTQNREFLDSLNNEPLDIKLCMAKEIEFLTKVSALIDYYLQIYDIEVPDWLRDEKLRFDTPYFHSRKISDFEKVKLQYTNPAPFKTRNVYFDLEGIKRV